MGAGTFHTIDNDKFVFNEPGVYTLLHIPKTINNPEVRIQIRLERYPNRRVDFSMLGRYLSQEQLVQPTNATVITGIALEATGTEANFYYLLLVVSFCWVSVVINHNQKLRMPRNLISVGL